MSWQNSYYDDDALAVFANGGYFDVHVNVENQKVNPTDLDAGTFTSDG